MNNFKKTLVITIAAASLALAGCKKKTDDAAKVPAKPGAGSVMAGSGSSGSGPGSVMAGSGPGSVMAGSGATAPIAQAQADYVKVTADHVDAGKGKVDVVFSKWSVTKASFDPANLEGGTAELSIDLTSLSSGIPDRDGHLQTPDFLDTAKFATAMVKVDNVKKSDSGYTADALLNLHGVEKKLAITFTVTATTADSVTIKISYPFSRLDFQIAGVQDKVKPDVVFDAQITVKKM
jgi:polyisoprenoid-binding protein YceI